jgi:DNA-binding XRE family transcriptional regulator
MSTGLGTVLRNEITRLARKATRMEMTPAQKTMARQRHDIAKLKHSLAAVQKELLALKRAQPLAESIERNRPAGAARKVRYAAKSLRQHRERMGLSQADYAKLLGVSAQSIYNWEREAARPRPLQIERIAAVRALGKRAAAARLKLIADQPGARQHK